MSEETPAGGERLAPEERREQLRRERGRYQRRLGEAEERIAELEAEVERLRREHSEMAPKMEDHARDRWYLASLEEMASMTIYDKADVLEGICKARRGISPFAGEHGR